MDLSIDLHCHSNLSDGTLPPREVVARARQNGVDVLALTDHDSVDGIAEAQAAALLEGVVLIPGVEVSVTWMAQTIHVVGLRVDPHNVALRVGLAALQALRVERARAIGKKLEKAGVPGAYEATVAAAGIEAVTRTHFARYLLEHGYAKDLEGAFKRWLGKNGKAYVRGDWASLGDAVAMIRGAGGQAVVAHPARYKLSSRRLMDMLKEFKAAGGVAIEVACGSHSEDDRQRFAVIALQLQLLSSAGSDFHSPANTRVDLGRSLRLPPKCVPIWDSWGLESTALAPIAELELVPPAYVRGAL